MDASVVRLSCKVIGLYYGRPELLLQVVLMSQAVWSGREWLRTSNRPFRFSRSSNLPHLGEKSCFVLASQTLQLSVLTTPTVLISARCLKKSDMGEGILG